MFYFHRHLRLPFDASFVFNNIPGPDVANDHVFRPVEPRVRQRAEAAMAAARVRPGTDTQPNNPPGYFQVFPVQTELLRRLGSSLSKPVHGFGRQGGQAHQFLSVVVIDG